MVYVYLIPNSLAMFIDQCKSLGWTADGATAFSSYWTNTDYIRTQLWKYQRWIQEHITNTAELGYGIHEQLDYILWVSKIVDL